MFDNNGRRIYTDFRELAEAKRQEAYEQMRREAEAVRKGASVDDGIDITRYDPSFSGYRDESPEIEAAHREDWKAGRFKNSTLHDTFTVLGDFDDENWHRLLVQPGQMTPDGFDADFFLVYSKWYKIRIGVVSIKKTASGYSIHGLFREANKKELVGIKKFLGSLIQK